MTEEIEKQAAVFALKNYAILRLKPMNDEEFLNYVETHSKTERALFHISHAQRLLDLSGNDRKLNVSAQWIAIRHEAAEPFIQAARLRFRRAQFHVIQGEKT